ncbi:MAG: acyclic terpene utilization AtuA family protein [Variovorax sp.]
MTTEIKILPPVGMLGYGIPEADFWRGIDAGADAVVVDAGSTDPGPYLLGLGKMIVAASALERDLRLILAGCNKRKIPLLIGSAGGPGIGKHVDETIETIRRIAKEKSYRLKVAAVYADVKPELVRDRFASGRIVPCASAPALKAEDIEESTHIVAQMGVEPILKVLREHPDVNVVVAGRAYDPAPYAAFCMLHGIEDPGIFWHMGKIMECGANCAEPKGRVILATIRQDSFDLEPMNPLERCTPLSVAAHTLYEKTRPDLLAGPGGVLDLTGATYVPLNDRTVRVSGSVFRPSPVYQVKLEGAAIAGQRTIFVGGIRDPILVGQIDTFLEALKKRLAGVFPELQSGAAQVDFHVYGKNGVMGALEPEKDFVPLEVGILGEVTAATQDLANAICSSARIGVLHMPYKGQMATAGNFAIPLNPPENPIGPVCRFSLYHLMEVESPLELFPSRIEEIA